MKSEALMRDWSSTIIKFIFNEIRYECKKRKIEIQDFPILPGKEILKLIVLKKMIGSSNTKKVLSQMLDTGKSLPDVLIDVDLWFECLTFDKTGLKL